MQKNETIHPADNPSSISTKGQSAGEHTPGPWEIRRRLGSVGDPTKNGRYVILQTGSSLREDFYICESPFAACRGADEREQEANARLIAAAPDMLKALREIMADTADLEPAYSLDLFPETRQLIRAAIAKATEA